MSQKNRRNRNSYGTIAMPTEQITNSTQEEELIVNNEVFSEVVQQPVEVNNITNPIPVDPIGEPMQSTQEQSLQIVPAFINELNAYANAMHAQSGIDSNQGGLKQYELWQTVKSIIAPDDGQEAFNARWNMLLDFVKQYIGSVFSETQLFRFPDSWYGTTTEFNAYRRLLYLIMRTCDPVTRKENLRYIVLDIALSEGFTEPEKNKISNFYY